MNSRETDVEQLFDRNADTRLLERRRREELGLAPAAQPASSTPARFGPESMLGDGVPLAAPRGAMLSVALQARPARELIPGALVTLVAELFDAGDTDADGVVLRIAIPPEAEPIAGSFARDDVELDAEALLGEGLQIGTVAAAETIRIRFSIRVLPGTEPLDLLASAHAPGVPTIATPALRLTRRAGHVAYDAPRPFFEYEAGEAEAEPDESTPPETASGGTIDTLVGDPIVMSVIREAVAPEPPPLPAPAAPAPAPVEIVAAPEPQPEPEPEPVLAAAEPGPVPPAEVEQLLARVLDADEIRALERVFSGAVPHGLAALALLSSVAAVDTPLGVALGVRDFARSVAAALPRALVAARMNRPTPPVVTPEALATIDAQAAAGPDAPTSAYEGPILSTRLDARELDGLRTVLGRGLDDPFLRGVQVLLAVVPRALDGAEPGDAELAGEALAAYRRAAGAWLMRVTVRRAVDRRYDPLTADDATLHEAGRELVATLRGAIR